MANACWVAGSLGNAVQATSPPATARDFTALKASIQYSRPLSTARNDGYPAGEPDPVTSSPATTVWGVQSPPTQTAPAQSCPHAPQLAPSLDASAAHPVAPSPPSAGAGTLSYWSRLDKSEHAPETNAAP